jgi:protein-L-isoaspartate(D-aspartate) O-methyltransferase
VFPNAFHAPRQWQGYGPLRTAGAVASKTGDLNERQVADYHTEERRWSTRAPIRRPNSIIDALLSTREDYVPTPNAKQAHVGEKIISKLVRPVLAGPHIGQMLEAAGCSPAMSCSILMRLGYSDRNCAIGRFCRCRKMSPAFAQDAQQNPSDHGLITPSYLKARWQTVRPQERPMIMLQGAVEHIPANLLAQIKEGGRIVAIFAEGALRVRIGRKIDFGTDEFMHVFFFNAGVLFWLDFLKKPNSRSDNLLPRERLIGCLTPDLIRN